MAGTRLRAVIAVLSAAAVFAAPANAAIFPIEPVNADGDRTVGEEPVLKASVHVPAGRVQIDNDFGLTWTGKRIPGGRRCRPLMLVLGSASLRPVPLPSGLRRQRPTRVVVATAAGPRQLSATTYAIRDKDFGTNRLLRFELPREVLPDYPRRHILLMAVSFRAPCAAAREQAARAVARAMRSPVVNIPSTYSPPPPLDAPAARDLAATPGLLMKGAGARDEAGRDVAAAGDVNGDGLADALISSPYSGAGKRGAADVVFGHPGGGMQQLGRLGAAGFRITGPSDGAYGLPAAGIGDLDGDGLGDLIVGAPAAAREGGVAYVIRGSASPDQVDLARPGDRLLFKIAGGRRCNDFAGAGGDNLGAAVASAGDVNGDGLPDVAVLVAHNCFEGGGGGIYIVFGSRSHATVDVSRLGARGIAAPASYPAQLADAVIAGAGDTNGDGLADLVIGRGDSGSNVPVAEVIPGRRSGGTVRLARAKFQLYGREGCNDGNASVAGAGDVNGDGLADIVVAGGSDSCAESGLGLAYVIFGTRTPRPVDLTHLADQGFRIHGLVDSQFAAGVSGVGDVNGDGLADVAVADSDATVFGRRLAGEIFLVPGRREPGTIELRWAARAGVFAWGGSHRQAGLGRGLAGIGDFDGDGRPDLLAGAPGPEPTPGEAFVLPMPALL